MKAYTFFYGVNDNRDEQPRRQRQRKEHSFHNAYIRLYAILAKSVCPYARRKHHTTHPYEYTRLHTHTHTSIRQTRSIRASNLNVKFKELTRAYCTLNKNHNNDNELLPKNDVFSARTHTHEHTHGYSVFGFRPIFVAYFQCQYVHWISFCRAISLIVCTVQNASHT